MKAFTWTMFASMATLTLSLNTAIAEDTPNGEVSLEEIVVQARRVAERLQDVPVAVSAFTQDQLQALSVTRTEDLTRITPSLGATPSTRGDNSPIFTIRGQHASDVSLLTDPAIEVCFAEVCQTRMTGSNATLFDLESVEVLKGPQGTLFGHNTTGGAILLRPKEPEKEFGGYLRAQGGNYNFRDLEAALNTPVSDTLAARFSVKATRRDGYLHNVLTGQDNDDLNELSGRAIVEWNPTDAFKSETIGTYYHSATNGGAVKIDQFNPAGVPAPFRAFFAPLIAADLAQNQALGKYEYTGALQRDADDTVWSVQNTTQFVFNPHLTLRNIAGYKDIYTRYQIEQMAVQVLNTCCGRLDSNQKTEELQLVADEGRMHLVGGLFYFVEGGNDYRVSESFAQLPAPSPVPFTLNDFDAKNTSYSAYVHTNVTLDELAKGLSISAGGRLTRDERSVDYYLRNQIGGPEGHGGPIGPYKYQCILTGAVSSVNTRNSCSTPAEVTFTEPTYDASLNYALTPDVLLYAAHRHGYRTGGFILSPSVAPADLEPYKPEFVDDNELGAKTEFRIADVPVRANTALYYSKGSDVQRQVNVLAQNRIANKIINAAGTTIYGAELELTARLTQQLRVDLSYSFTHAAYSKWTDTYLVAGVPTVVDISDSKFTDVPQTQLSLSTRYTLPLPSSIGDISLFASYYYQSPIASTDNNTSNCGPNGLYPGCLNVNTGDPGYALLNLRADWDDVMGKGFDVGLYVNNATDKFYKQYGFTLNNAVGWRTSFIGAPLMWGLEFRVPFGAKH